MNIVFKLSMVVVLLFVFLIGSFNLFENVNADKIMIIQSPVSGELTAHTTPGVKWQGFGKVTYYPKRAHFETMKKTRFNDGGEADVTVSAQWSMPLDNEQLFSLHTKYGSQNAIATQLVEKAMTKAIYLTGPLLSSRESYAEKRADMINWFEDQVVHGIYETKQVTTKTQDELLGKEKTVVISEIDRDKSGMPKRREGTNILPMFGIDTFNYTVEAIEYDEKTKMQIAKQKEMIMEVQTKIAEAKKAEQDAITAEQSGLANVMRARYEKEEEKVRQVVTAEQRRDVAKLDKDAAEFEKQKQILLGEGEATRKKLVMNADGALEKKLEAYQNVSKMYADAIAAHQGNWVPSVVMGGEQKGNGASDLINLLTAKTAKDLSLSLDVKGN